MVENGFSGGMVFPFALIWPCTVVQRGPCANRAGGGGRYEDEMSDNPMRSLAHTQNPLHRTLSFTRLSLIALAALLRVGAMGKWFCVI